MPLEFICRGAEMMDGRQTAKSGCSTDFNLDDHILPNYLLRSIDQCLNLRDLQGHFADSLGRFPLIRLSHFQHAI